MVTYICTSHDDSHRRNMNWQCNKWRHGGKKLINWGNVCLVISSKRMYRFQENYFIRGLFEEFGKIIDDELN